LYGANHDLIPGVTANNDRDSSFEVFSPPYLFRGPRPAIAAVQRGIAWGSSFNITTPQASTIGQVVLSRLPTPQHTVDTDARTIRLAFTKGEGIVTATAPPSDGLGRSAVAPPGYYYLFLLSADGVPSVARIVHIGATSDMTGTTPVYTSGDPNNPGPPDASIGASPDADSSYINQPPPLPLGGWIIGLIAVGAGLPALRRRFNIEDVS
jgi:hypothetical protein